MVVKVVACKLIHVPKYNLIHISHTYQLSVKIVDMIVSVQF